MVVDTNVWQGGLEKMMDIELPRIQCIEMTDDYAKYEAEPLPAGYGLTLGNALRRVLLSSLPGAAITAVRFEGIPHEFASIPGVKEDATEIVLNLKKIRLRLYADEEVQLRLSKTGPGEMTAADIETTSDVEIITPEQHIATLNGPEAELTMYLTVNKGKGYQTAEQQEGLMIGVIPIDALFSPVKKVNFQVENTRVGQMTNFDRLVLEVWTDGTMNGEDAISYAAQILVQHLGLFANLSRIKVTPEAQVQAAVVIPPKIYDMPIEELDLPSRAYNALKHKNISKVGQLLGTPVEELLRIRNFGKRSLDDLRARLREKGLIPQEDQEELAEVKEK